MCGIIGFVGFNDSSLIKKMTKKLEYRGPDGKGFFSDKNIELGHRRLSIIDLKTGKQPIFNENKDVCIIYNGELYNFKELKEDLIKKGHKFCTNSDTEVIIHAYEEYKDFMAKLNGIFAFAIYDLRKKQLILARDRIGVKPLYYFIEKGNLFFASELKVLLMAKERKEIDKRQVGVYLRWGHFPTENTLVEGIKKLLPGHILIYKDGKVEIRRYWELNFNEENGLSLDYWKKSFIDEFRNAVKSQLMSDVPLGIFLSGGLDSSSIASMAKLAQASNIKTFSVGFECEDVENELIYAKNVAEYLGTEHKELIVKEEVPKFLDEIIYYLDEPVANLASIPLFFMSKKARRYVKVILTGSGGDELFAGYRHYNMINFAVKNSFFLKSLYPLASAVSKLNANQKINRYSKFAKEYFKNSSSPQKLFQLLRLGNNDEDFVQISEIFQKNWALVNKLLGMDIKFLLPENYLLIEDRMTMAHSLEARVPFLDNSMIKFSEKLPSEFKLKGFVGKRIVRNAMKNHIPQQIIKRKKYGFTAPLAKWWKDYFHTEMENLMPEIKKQKLLDYQETSNLLNLAKQGNHESINKLWPRLVLQMWLSKFNLSSFE